MVIRYFFRKKSTRFLFHLIDFFLKVPIKKLPIPQEPKFLLLCHPAHLGDTILTTSLLPVLKKRYPLLKIGMLVSSNSSQVIKNHNLVDFIHTIDHWKLNRSSHSFLKKMRIYYKTRRKVLKEIGHYDVSVDCNFHFPNLSVLMWQAKIPIRLGFTTSGFSNFLTHPTSWEDKKQHASDYFLDLLKPLNIVKEGPLKPHLPLKEFSHIPRHGIVIHMGTGDDAKKWPLQNWRTFLENIDPKDNIYLTGFGTKEEKDILALLDARKNIVNLANQLSWDEFVYLIKEAKLYVGVDSCGGHIASAFDTPSLLIYKSVSTLWKPLSQSAKILIYPTAEEMLIHYEKKSALSS